MATTWTCLLVLAALAGRVAVEAGLAVARPDPHVVEHAAQQRVAEGQDPLAAFGQCHEHCIGTYKQCQSGCADNQGHNDIPCIERCIDEQLIGCSCGCAALLPPETPESRISGTAVLRTVSTASSVRFAMKQTILSEIDEFIDGNRYRYDIAGLVVILIAVASLSFPSQRYRGARTWRCPNCQRGPRRPRGSATKTRRRRSSTASRMPPPR